MRRSIVGVLIVGCFGVFAVPASAADVPRRVIVTLRTSLPNLAGLPGGSGIASGDLVQQQSAIAAGTEAVETIVAHEGGEIVRRYRTVPYVAVRADDATVAALGRSPAVVSVVEDHVLATTDAESTPLVGGNASQAAGISGSGKAVAVLDTGIDATHPFLAGAVVDESCFSGLSTCPNGLTTQLGPGAAAPCAYAPIDCRHGTHVAGIAAGGPAAGVPFTGVAPEASIVAVQVFSRFTDPVCSGFGLVSPCALALNSDLLAGLEHVYERAAQLHVASVNMSIGGPVRPSFCDSNVLKPAIDNLRSIGVATIIATGNNASATGISEPACISSAVAVGATTESDTVASYSNSASMMKLWAPGSVIRSSVPGGDYADFNGTSMAAPHVAGAFALARQLYPADSVAQLVFRFRYAGVPITDARNGLTFPRLEIVGALAPTTIVPGTVQAEEGRPIPIPLTLTRASTLPVTARYVTLAWTATDGLDFVGGTGTVTFAPGSTTTTAVIPGIEDAVVEGNELLLVSFSGATNATIGGTYGLGGALIYDDDPPLG